MILVTGGTGLVGRHLLLDLSKEMQPIRAIYRDEKSINDIERFFKFSNAAAQFKMISWHRADILDLLELAKAFEGIRYVYHCAALISFDPYQFEALKKTNEEGTANVVNFCLKHSVSKLVYLSSIATLSNFPLPITESNYWDPNARNSVYALSKYGAEMEVWRGTQEGLNAVIFNPGIILGIGSYTQGSGQLFKKVAEGLQYYPKGATLVVSVEEVVAMMLQGMKSSLSSQRYILGQTVTYKKLLTTIAKSLNTSVPQKELKDWQLNLLWRLDYIRGLFLKKRSLTKVGARSLQTNKTYSTQKAADEFGHLPKNLSQTIAKITPHYKSTSLY